MLDSLKILNIQIIFISVLLFFIGYGFAPTAYFKRITWLTAYPFFIIRLMDRYFKKDWHPVTIFVVIFSLNSISLFINLLSGLTLVLPYVFMIYLGINIGVIMYHTLEGKFYYVSLLNPVALFELPAAWISITMAIQYGLVHYLDLNLAAKITLAEYMIHFLKTVIPLLFIAGIIETVIIIFSRKKEKD